MGKFTDEIQTTVTIENDQAINELGKLEMAHADVRKELNGLYKDMREYDKAVAKVSKYELGAKKFEEASKKASLLNTEIEKYSNLLKTAQTNAKGLQKGTAEYDEAKNKVSLLSSKLTELKKSLSSVNSEATKNKLNASKFAEASKEVKNLQANVDKFNETAKKVKEASNAVDEYRNSLKATEMTMKQMRKEAKLVQSQLDNTVKGTAGYDKLKNRLLEVNSAISAQNADLKHTAKGWSGFSASFKSFGAMAAGVIGGELILQSFQAIIGFIGSIATGAAKISDELSDIQKTSGATREEVKAMNSEFSKFDTRSSTSSLREIAKIAGQIGIAKEEIVDFTREVDKANVALGDEFSGGAAEITKQLGTIKNLFKETKDLKAADAITKIGSALNALGAAGQAQAPEMADFAKRLGVLGKLAPSLTETLGLASALTGELGLTAEQGAGGVSGILLEAGKRTKEFSQQIGITEKEFKNLLNTDPNEMFLKLAQSMQGLTNDQVITSLQGIGITSQESIKTMQALATNTDIVVEKQRLAAVELKKGTSLQEEYNLKNNNFAASLEKAGKAWSSIIASMGTGLEPIMKPILDLFTALFGKIEDTNAASASLNETVNKVPKYLQPLITVFKKVKDAFKTIWDAIMDTLKAFGLFEGESKALEFIINILVVAIELLAFQFVAIANSIRKSRDEFVKYYNESETFRKIVTGSVNAVKQVFANFFDTISKGFSAISDLVGAIATGDLKKLESAMSKSLEVMTDLLFTNQKKIADEFIKGYEKGADKIVIKTQVQVDTEKADAELKKQQESLDKATAEQANLIKKVQSLKFIDAASKQSVIEQLGDYAQKTAEQRKELAKSANELVNKNNQILFSKNSKGAGKKANDKAEKLIQEWKDFQAKIKALQEEESLNSLSGENREIADAQAKYADLIEEAKKFKKDKEQVEAEILKIEDLKMNELAAIRKKFADEEQKARDEKKKLFEEEKKEAELTINLELASENQREILEMEAHYTSLIALATKFGLDTVALEQAKTDALNALQTKQAEAKTAKTIEENEKQRVATFQFANTLTDLFTATNNLMGEQSAGYLEFQKMITLAQIAIDTASAISSITSKQAATSLTPIDYAIKVAAGIAVVLANIAKAKTVLSKADTPKAPKFSTGGEIEIKGNSHAQGGISMINGNGKKVGEMEGDESYLLLSKKTTQNNRPLLQALLKSSKTNGAAVKAPNFGAMQKATNTSSNTTVNNNTTNNKAYSDELMLQLLIETRLNREAFENSQKEVKAVISYQDLEKTNTKMNNVKNYSGQ